MTWNSKLRSKKKSKVDFYTIAIPKERVGVTVTKLGNPIESSKEYLERYKRSPHWKRQLFSYRAVRARVKNKGSQETCDQRSFYPRVN